MRTTRGQFCEAFWLKYPPNLAGVCCEEPRLKEPGPNLLTHGHTPAANEKDSPKHQKPIFKNTRVLGRRRHHGDDSRAPLWSVLVQISPSYMSRGTKQRSVKDA